VAFNPGSTTIAGAPDVALNTLTDKDAFIYDQGVGKWVNKAQPDQRNVVVSDFEDLVVAGDWSPAVQAAMDQSVSDGVECLLVPGDYSCDQSLLVDSSLHLRLLPGARLIKNFANGGGTTGSFLRNRDFATKVSGVVLTGPGIIRAATQSQTGNIIGLYGDQMRLQNFAIDQYAGGRAIVSSGDDWRICNLKISGAPVASGTGGIRVMGGARNIVSHCDVMSGDDAYQFVPSAASGDPLFDSSIRDSSFINCTGRSTNARLIIAGLIDPSAADGAETMSASITGCSFENIRGYSSQVAAISVHNENSSGSITDVTIENCSIEIETTGSQSSLAGSVMLFAPASAGIRDLMLRSIRVVGQPNDQRALALNGNLFRTTLEDLQLSRAAGATTVLATIGGTDTKLIGGVFDGGGVTSSSHVIVLGRVGAGFPPVRPQVLGRSHIGGISNGGAGIRLVDATDARIHGARFDDISGATTARALSIGPTTDGTRVSFCDVTDINAALKVDDSGSSSSFFDNRGIADTAASSGGTSDSDVAGFVADESSDTHQALDAAYALRGMVDLRAYGAVFANQDLSTKYSTLSEAQADYPFATSLAQMIDWAATQAAVNAAESTGGGGTIFHPGSLAYMGNDRVSVMFAGIMGVGDSVSVFRWQGADGGIDFGVVDGTGSSLTFPGQVTGVKFNGDFATNDLVAVGCQAGPKWIGVDIRNSAGSLLRLSQTQNGYFAKVVAVAGDRCLDIDNGANGNTFVACLFTRGKTDHLRINDSIPSNGSISAGNNPPGRNVFSGCYFETTESTTQTIIRIHGGQQNTFDDCRINHTQDTVIPLVTVENGASGGFGFGDFRNLTFARCRFAGKTNAANPVTILDQSQGKPIRFENSLVNNGVAATAFVSHTVVTVYGGYLGAHASGEGWLRTDEITTVKLASDVAVSNNTAMSDTELSARVLPGETYEVSAFLMITGLPTADAKITFFPSTSNITGTWTSNSSQADSAHPASTIERLALAIGGGRAVGLGGTSYQVAALPIGHIEATSAGAITVRFAQNVSNATPSTLLAESRFVLRRLS